MTIISRFFVTLPLLLTFAAAGQAQSNGRSPSLDHLVKLALENNPEIKAAERRWRAAEARPAQVSTLPDPMLSYSRFGSSVETRVGPQENAFVLSQSIPFPGKLGLRGDIARQDAVAEAQKSEATRRDVVFKVKQAYYDLYWIDSSIAILTQYVDVLRDFTTVAEQKYATGQGIQANVLKSQVELSSTLEKRLGFEKLREGAAARLNALLNRPQSTEVPPATALNLIRVDYDKQALVEYALAQREELLATQAMIDKSHFMRRLARKNFFPDFSLQANYIDISEGQSIAPDAGKNAWSVMLGLNLPIWLGKRKAAVREADEMISSNKLSEENLANQIMSEIEDLYYRLELSRKTLDLYEQGLITQAESSLESATASYRTGQLDFLSLLDAERMLLNLHLGFEKEQASYQKTIAALERAVGGELPQ